MKYIKYPSDRTTYKKLIKLFEEKQEEKLFLFCVTMQNHGGYTEQELKGYESTVELSYEEDYPQAETYLSLARESDKAFRNLIDYFSEVEEPTMIVLFGDHWPNLEWGFFNELLGKDFGSLDMVDTQMRFFTPYLIWVNYPIGQGTEDMSANYFGSYILQQAGLPMSAYNEFLLDMKEVLPIVETGMVCDAQGDWYDLNAPPQEYEEWIREYRILQYNNVFDRVNRIDTLFRLENAAP